MNITEYLHTKEEIVQSVYSMYLNGYSTEEIHIKIDILTPQEIDNIIDVSNLYLGVNMTVLQDLQSKELE